LAAYRAGEYEAARQECHALRTRPGDGAWRIDTEVIDTLCLLFSPARADMQEGRTRLAQLAEQDPTLWDEPECHLAIGHALSALHETAEALRTLPRAVAGFAAAGLPARQADALLELAGTWTRHGEWELTPASFGVPLPAGPREADQIRRRQIEGLRPRIEALPDHDEALERYELVRGSFLVDSQLDPAAGVTALEPLAAWQELTATRAAAASRLAEWHEAAGRAAQAAALYERVAKEWHGPLAWRAAQRQTELAQPKIELDIPASAPTERAVRPHVRARGVSRVSLEVRSVDVETWLSVQRTRGHDLLLGEAGGVQLARDFDTRTEDAFAWWTSEREATPVEFHAPAGAYVVIARGDGADGRTVTLKRLLTISDLTAECVVGPERVLVWATLAGQRPTPPGQRPTPLAAKFWMHSSFVPVTRELSDGVAGFPLPNEARLSRERGWVCLVRAGEHLAVCRGQLPGSDHAAPRAALSAGPPAAVVGQTIYVTGLLVAPEGEPLDLGGTNEVRLEIADTLRQVLIDRHLPLTAGGTFTTELVVPSAAAGRQLRFVVRLDEQVLELVGARPAVNVSRADDPRFRVLFDVPTWLWPSRAILAGTLRAEYPWGTVPTDTHVELTLRALHLPGADGEGTPAWGTALADRGALDARGVLPFTIPLHDLVAPGAPAAVQVTAGITSWEGRTGTGQTHVLVTPAQPHLWIQCEPHDPEVGSPIRFHLGWFAPNGLPIAEPPAVEVSRDGVTTQLATAIDAGGYTSAPWIPPAPGEYEVTAFAGPSASVRRTVTIADRPDDSGSPADEVRCEAAWAKTGAAVDVDLTGTVCGPLLVLVAGRNPLGAVRLAEVVGHAHVEVPVAAVGAGAHVRVLRPGYGDGEELGRWPVRAASNGGAAGPTLQLSPATSEVWPGGTALVRVEQPRGDEAVLMARLIDTTHPPSFQPSGRSTARDADALDRMLRIGETLWCASATFEDEQVLRVPVPAQPGLYQLALALRSADGYVTTGSLLLDARRGVLCQVDLPPRLRVGDRALLAVRLVNGYAAETDASINVTLAEGLHADALEVVGAKGDVCRPGESQVLTLPPGREVWLRGDVEATAAGAGRVSVSVCAHDRTEVSAGSCEILRRDLAPPDSPLVLRRTVLVRTAIEDEGVDGPHRHWQWAALATGARLVPGQYLRIEEELTTSLDLPPLTWSQELPATCRAGSAGFGLQDEIGRRRDEEGADLVYSVARMRASTFKHSYYLAVVRPGACSLPAPVLRSGEQIFPIRVEPTELRLIVLDER
jgi:hypothetical protein